MKRGNKFMDLYKKIEVKESYFHTGFLYGFLIFFIASNLLRDTFYSDRILVLTYLIADQFIYRMWIKKEANI